MVRRLVNGKFRAAYEGVFSESILTFRFQRQGSLRALRGLNEPVKRAWNLEIFQLTHLPAVSAAVNIQDVSSCNSYFSKIHRSYLPNGIYSL